MTFSAIILAAAKSIGVPGALLLAICTHESNLTNVMVPQDNGSPSYGLCQIKEETANQLGFEGKPTGPMQESDAIPGTMAPSGMPVGLMLPKVNAKYAAKYLKMQLDRYEGDWCKATAAYNAGKYNPSKVLPGKPRNLMYIKRVVLHLDERHKDFLICGPRKLDNEYNEP